MIIFLELSSRYHKQQQTNALRRRRDHTLPFLSTMSLRCFSQSRIWWSASSALILPALACIMASLRLSSSVAISLQCGTVHSLLWAARGRAVWGEQQVHPGSPTTEYLSRYACSGENRTLKWVHNFVIIIKALNLALFSDYVESLSKLC